MTQRMHHTKLESYSTSYEFLMTFNLHAHNVHTVSDLFHYLHVGKLLHGRKARQVEPGHVLPVFVVISLVLQVPEGGATQSVKLQSVLLLVWTCHDIYIYRRSTQRTTGMNMST